MDVLFSDLVVPRGVIEDFRLVVRFIDDCKLDTPIFFW